MPASDKTFNEYVKYLQTTHGLDEKSARAVVGNFAQESSLNHRASNGSHWGLGQWDRNRYKGLQSFAKTKGKTADDPFTQLDYTVHELNTTHKKAMKAMSSAPDITGATRAFQNYYEVAPGQDDDKRIRYATQGFEGGRNAPVIKATKLSPVGGSTSAQQVNQLTQNTVIPNVTTNASPMARPMGNSVPISSTDTGFQPYQREVKDVRGMDSTPTMPRSKFASVVDSVAPYASNIANLFSKPPMPPKPILDTPVSLNRVSMNNDRYEVERGARSGDRFAENQLDPQAAFAAKAFNNAQRFNQLSKVNQDERNMNTDISNKEVQINTVISASNNQLRRGYQDDLTQRTLAQQRFQADNLANASEKYTMQQDVKLARQLAAERERMARSQDWNNIYGRYEQKAMGGKLPRYSAGHMIKSMNLKRIN